MPPAVTPATPPATPASSAIPAEAPAAAGADTQTPAAADAPEPTLQLTPASDAGVDPLDEAAAALDAPRRPRRSGRKEAKAESRARRRAEKAAEKAAKKEAEEDAEAEERQRIAPADALVARLPAIKPIYAAILTGALAGLAAVGLAFGAARGCEAVRDTESCGGGAGLLAVVAILAIEVLIGANLLKAWQIADPVSTSFLGVGVVATIAMLTFLEQLDSPWMLLVIPLMTAVSFALSWWITVRFIDEYEPGPHPSPVDDIADQDEDSHA